jgi:hypothetical protein
MCRQRYIGRGVGRRVRVGSDPRQAEPTRQFGDQLQVADIGQRRAQAGVRCTEDGGQAAFGGPRHGACTERLPRRDGAQADTDPVGQLALGET